MSHLHDGAAAAERFATVHGIGDPQRSCANALRPRCGCGNGRKSAVRKERTNPSGRNAAGDARNCCRCCLRTAGAVPSSPRGKRVAGFPTIRHRVRRTQSGDGAGRRCGAGPHPGGNGRECRSQVEGMAVGWTRAFDPLDKLGSGGRSRSLLGSGSRFLNADTAGVYDLHGHEVDNRSLSDLVHAAAEEPA